MWPNSFWRSRGGAFAASRHRDIANGSEWDSERIDYWDEIYVDGVSRLALAGQKVHSAAELDDIIAASLTAPGIRWLWIHEDLLEEARRHWTRPEVAGKSRRQVHGPAMIGAGVAAALAAGLVAFAEVPPTRAPVVGNQHAAQYAVSVGTFTSAESADRIKHLVGGKGYIVVVVQRGSMREVRTRPYRTREQAERIARGLEAAGVRAHLLAWRPALDGDRTARF